MTTEDARAALAERIDTMLDELSGTAGWLKRTGGYLDADRVMRAIALLREAAALVAQGEAPSPTEPTDEVVAAAIEYVENSGPFRASDGYMAYAVGDDRRLRNAVAAFAAHRTQEGQADDRS